MNNRGIPPLERRLWEEKVPGGAHWSGLLRRGTTLRISDTQGGGNCSVLFYNYEDRLERYNMADTLKGQHTAFITQGHVCYSDMGRVMCSVTEDSCGWHDPICGVSTAQSVKAKYGEASYQEKHNDYYRNGYDSLINELGKYGMGKRDVMPPLNLFSKVTVDDSGCLKLVTDNSAPGDYIDLRFEMDALIVLSTCQHPLDPGNIYAPKEMSLSCWRSPLPGPDDFCRNRCPENQRAFANTERMFP